MSDKAKLINTLDQYEFDMRVTSINFEDFNIYTNKNSFKVDKGISFDIDNKEITSTEYFIGSIASDILLNILKIFKDNEITIEYLDAKIKYVLDNPLTLLDVIGYYDNPSISKIEMVIYICADVDTNEINKILDKSLNLSLLYNTIVKSVEFNIKYKIEEY